MHEERKGPAVRRGFVVSVVSYVESDVDAHAWASLGSGSESGNYEGERETVPLGEPCLVYGCGVRTKKGHGNGQGYCPKHYRQLHRTGNPEPRSVWAPRALREAVFAWAADPTPATVGEVFHAAWAMLPTVNGPQATRDIDPDRAAELLAAADAYAWHDTSVAGDETFPAVSKALDEAALRFARSLATYTNLRGSRNVTARTRAA